MKDLKQILVISGCAAVLFWIVMFFVLTCSAAELSDGDSRYEEFVGYRDYRAYKDEFRSSAPDVIRTPVITIYLEPNDGATDMSMHYPRECLEDITYNECMQIWNDRDRHVWERIRSEFHVRVRPE